MGTVREFHTATLLSSGKVLMAGGGSSYVELYDPETGVFSATGSLPLSPSNSTATLLTSGKVLIAGGYTNEVVAKAWLYDPATGRVTATGGMNTPRSEHTATLLSSGKVLIAGGFDSSFTTMSSAELYDPTEGVFTATGGMQVARRVQMATLLPSGEVLITGGVDPFSATLGSSEVYDPKIGTFTSNLSMSSARVFQTQTLLGSGNVLITGGGTDSAEVFIQLPPSPPSLSGQPTAQTNSGSASISFSGESGASFTCSVDGAAYAACTSPRSLSSLREGVHSVDVKQTDQAGNTSDASTVAWTVDLTAPTAPSLTSKPPSLTNSASASFPFIGEQNASFTCSIDAGAYSTCTNPASFSNLAEGSHSFSVKQTDQAGNVGPASAPATWTIDLTPPVAPVLSGAPSALTNLNTAKISFTASTDKTFTCSLDGATPSSCNKSVSLSGLSEGSHTFVVSHSDPAGNTSSATATWLVDTTIPSLSASASGGKIKTKTQTTYYLSVNSDVTGISKVEYTTASRAPAMNAKNVASKTVPYSSTVVFQTSSRITWIRIQDGAGNWSRWYIG